MSVRLAALGLMAVTALLGQDAALERVSLASARVREAAANLPEFADAPRKQLTDLHLALRDWIESRLPKTKAELDAGLPLLQQSLTADLARTGLLGGDDFKYGTIAEIKLSRPPEYPEALLAIASVGAGGGRDEAVYLYDWSDGNPVRKLESIPDANVGVWAAIDFSTADDRGNRLAVVTRFCTHCEGCWSGMGYTLYRLGRGSAPGARLRSGDEFVYCYNYEIKMKPDDFLLEFPGFGIDTNFLMRTHVLHYKVGEDGAVRIDPVAYEPRDFVDEWLTRPWDEMAGWSSANAREELKKWHGVLHSDTVLGDFKFVQRCTQKPGQWQIAVDLGWVAGKELPEPLRVYFLVQQKGKDRFQMTGISFHRQSGCSSQASPSAQHPAPVGSQSGRR
jgi:hypothetical protein